MVAETQEVVEQQQEDVEDHADEVESLKDDVGGEAEVSASNSGHTSPSAASVQDESTDQQQQQQSTDDVIEVRSRRGFSRRISTLSLSNSVRHGTQTIC